MRPILALLLLFTLCLPVQAARRCASCANGACSVSKPAQPHAPAGGIVIDGKRYEGGQFVPVKDVAAPVATADLKGGPVRAVVKKAGKAALAPVRFLKKHHGQRLFGRGC